MKNRKTTSMCEICLKLSITTTKRRHWHSKLTIKTPERRQWRRSGVFEGDAQFIFFCNPQKSSVSVCLMKILKSTVKRKRRKEENWRKLSNFCNISNFKTALFEIHQRFIGHFLNKLRVSYNVNFKQISHNGLVLPLMT